MGYGVWVYFESEICFVLLFVYDMVAMLHPILVEW